MMHDENYYDDNGEQLCDNLGNRFLINDGKNLYDIESNIRFYPNKIEEKTLCNRLKFYFNNPTVFYNNLKETIMTCTWKL